MECLALWFPNAPAGVFGIVLAVMGAIVSVVEFKGWRRWTMAFIFILLGVAEVTTIVRADAAHTKEVNGLQGQLEDIKKQTETNHHTHVEFNDPHVVDGDPYFPFHARETPDVAISFFNAGDQTASDSFSGYGLDVTPHPLSEDEETEIWRTSALHKALAAGGPLYAHTIGRYNTITTSAPLTKQQVIGLNSGRLSLCSTARVVWTDETGKYCSKSFRCFYREPGPYKPPVFNWHIQGWKYNREDKCSYEINQGR